MTDGDFDTGRWNIDKIEVTFSAACAAANERLCTEDEWLMECTAPAEHEHTCGNTFDREACACVSARPEGSPDRG